MAQQAKQAEIQQQVALKQVDNDAKKEIANIESQTKIKVAQMQTDAQRDIADAKESSEMVKKVADAEIRQREKIRDEERNRETPVEGITRNDLERAKRDI